MSNWEMLGIDLPGVRGNGGRARCCLDGTLPGDWWGK